MYRFGYLRRMQLLREGEAGGPTGSPSGEALPSSEATKAGEKNNVEPFQNPWDNPAQPKGEQHDAQTPAAPAQPAQAPQQVSFAEQLQKMDFAGGVDFASVMDKARDGDVTGMQDAFNEVGRQAFHQAVRLSAEYTKQQVAEAVNTALAKSKGSNQAEFAKRELAEKIPQAKDPALGPVVEGVFARYVERGDAVETAISNTKKYMEHMATKFGGTNRNTRPGQGGPFGQGEQGNSPFNSDEEETDFYAALSQGSREFNPN